MPNGGTGHKSAAARAAAPSVPAWALPSLLPAVLARSYLRRLERRRYEELESLGVRRLGQLAGLPGGAVAERLGPDGRRAWSLARGEQDANSPGETLVAPRRPAEPLLETLEFPEAVGQELTLRRGLGVLVDGLLARPERAGRPPRKLALWARLVGGASWRRITAGVDRVYTVPLGIVEEGGESAGYTAAAAGAPPLRA